MSDLTKHIYAIKRIINRGPVSDDANQSDREIAHHLKQARNRLIKQKLDKYHSVSPYVYQDLCLDLERGQYHDCPGIPETACFILKSTTDVPEVLEARWGMAAQPSYIDGRRLSQLNMTNREYSQYSLLHGQLNLKDKWLIHNKKLIIISEDPYLKKVLFSAIFADPEEVFYSNLSTCPTAGDPVDFTIDAELVDSMYELVIKTMALSYQFVRDDENDAKSVEVQQQDMIN